MAYNPDIALQLLEAAIRAPELSGITSTLAVNEDTGEPRMVLAIKDFEGKYLVIAEMNAAHEYRYRFTEGNEVGANLVPTQLGEPLSDEAAQDYADVLNNRRRHIIAKRECVEGRAERVIA